MMHDLLGRLAQFGGEGALCLLFVFSVFTLAMISQRICFVAQRHASLEKFLEELIPLVRARDMSRARSLCQQTGASVCSTALAGLWEAEKGLPAMQEAFDAATALEKIELEDRLQLLNELARLALVIGIVGSLFDLVTLGEKNELVPPSEVAIGRAHVATTIAALTPIVGGLLVAIPAWLTASILKLHAQRIVRECGLAARMICSQWAFEEVKPGSSAPSVKVHRMAG